MEMIETGSGNFRTALSFSEDEGSLNHGLGVERETSRSPISMNVMLAHRGGNVSLKGCGVSGDVLVAGSTDRRVGLVGLLHHGAEQTSELGKFTHKDSFAEFDVAEKAIDRISKGSVGGGGEHAFSK